MQSLVKEKLKEGAWVSGKSVNDEKFRGYIEALNTLNGTVKVKVTECDNDKSIGRTIECFTFSLELLPDEKLNLPGQLYNLIDIALSAKDREWFMELTTELNSVQQAKGNVTYASL
jgi:hypothetical protein